MHVIGTVTRLQVQRSTLKTGVKPDRTYDPAPLLAVPRLSVSPDGVLGAGPEDAWVVDVHHRAHPETKNGDGLHGVSVGFTSHYAAMRDRFGERMVVGCAGENVIVETDRMFTYDELAGGGGAGRGIAIVAPGSEGSERVRLTVLQVAHPCRPFTGWALGGRVEADVLKAHLQFLDNGMRGFYCASEGSGTVELGDRLVLL